MNSTKVAQAIAVQAVRVARCAALRAEAFDLMAKANALLAEASRSDGEGVQELMGLFCDELGVPRGG